MTRKCCGIGAPWNPAQLREGWAMPDFIFQSNIAHYKALLATETDARKIAMLHKLLEEEERKLTDWQAKNPRPKAAE